MCTGVFENFLEPPPSTRVPGRGVAVAHPYETDLGRLIKGNAEAVVPSLLATHSGQIDLISTSPPFPLNRKKKYGNLQGLGWPILSRCSKG